MRAKRDQLQEAYDHEQQEWEKNRRERQLVEEEIKALLTPLLIRSATSRQLLPPHMIYLVGDAILPTKRIYAGNAHNISLTLQTKNRVPGLQEEGHLTEGTNGGQRFDLSLQQPDRNEQFLEVELQAAGVNVKGASAQQQSLDLDFLRYHWNCHFTNPGDYEIALVMRVIHPSGVRNQGTIEHKMQVIQFRFISPRVARWAALVGIVLGIVATIAIIIGNLHLFGVGMSK
ncbi:MAG TPA: hypothetical protein VKT82_12245 [Ktedonobacterales bacterium]|nr:hypothetical protein [Ktedonobacterales bacterium]